MNEREKKQSLIPFNKLKPSKRNSEIYLVKGDLKESIKDNGLMESFTVKRLDDGYFEILSGNRRYASFKELLDENPDFTYVWVQGNSVYSPLRDGIPCKIVERQLSDSEELKTIMGSNDHRDYDKLEIYHVVMKWKDIYKDEGYEGKLNEKIAENAPISARTIADILSDKWVINSSNIDDVERYGSWAAFCLHEAENQKPEKAPKPKPKMDGFNKEYKYLDKIQDHHEKLDFDKLDIKDSYYDDLRENAVRTVKTIMEAYNLFAKDLKD
jgi:hypothetical protein